MIAAMTWTAPQIDRTFDVFTGEERALLDTFIEWHRQTLLWKCSGLTAEQLKTATVEPSKLTLLGLLRHMTDVERVWFSRRVLGKAINPIYWSEASPDGDFDEVADADAAADYAAYLAECQASREAVAGLPLEHEFVHPRENYAMSLRWVYLHMIEEYARHNGHADLLRERIDGATGE
jgi:uncharacterized damage-inducible protein DinB